MESRKRVAILIFDDVEVLDFAGPFEVFGVAGVRSGTALFEVITVALSQREVTARNGLQILAGETSDSAPTADIFIVPGGPGTRPQLQNPEMAEFIRNYSATAELTLSVCSGALLLAQAGLLSGKSATTHQGAIEELKAMDESVNVRSDARIIDNGTLITAGGVSAGIDMALYVVAKLVGKAIALETAHYMEYDWRHQDANVRLNCANHGTHTRSPKSTPSSTIP